ncbi:MAG: adenylate/guanylate cyclase domain-containing protein [Spirochaetota bacterium]
MNKLTTWILHEGKKQGSVAKLFDAFVGQLRELHIPILRANLSLPTLHPQVAVVTYKWRHKDLADPPLRGPHHHRAFLHTFSEGNVEESSFIHGIHKSHLHTNSPFYQLGLGEKYIHENFQEKQTEFTYPVFQDLYKLGATGYLAMPVSFSNGQFSPSSWATNKPGGFTPEDIIMLREAIIALEMLLETYMHQYKMQSLLELYLGKQTGNLVLNGSILRGDLQSIQSVIWYSDLRSFTALSTKLSSPELVKTLNEYFFFVSESIEKEKGEILKFIGDAILAIFPLEKDTTASVCQRALLAAKQANKELQQYNKISKDSKTPLQHGIALHVGEVQYGNIGGENRLDFTVIGKAVNLAARIEGLCGKNQKEILVSEEFQSYFESGFTELGRFELKGFQTTKAVYFPNTYS